MIKRVVKNKLIRRKGGLRVPPKNAAWLLVGEMERPYLVDKEYLKTLQKLSWTFDKMRKKPRATFRKQKLFLHKIVCNLSGVDWNCIKFLNDDDTDCRFSNLRPFDISKDRKSKKRGDNSTGLTGVYFRASAGKYRVMIGVKGKRKFLGDFADLKDAGEAYARAWNEAHPTRKPMRVAFRGSKVFYDS